MSSTPSFTNRKSFETRLAVGRLRDFLRRLPDFDDVEAEERALQLFADVSRQLLHEP